MESTCTSIATSEHADYSYAIIETWRVHNSSFALQSYSWVAVQGSCDGCICLSCLSRCPARAEWKQSPVPELQAHLQATGRKENGIVGCSLFAQHVVI